MWLLAVPGHLGSEACRPRFVARFDKCRDREPRATCPLVAWKYEIKYSTRRHHANPDGRIIS